MLKLLGAVLIVLAGTLAGFKRAAQYADRPRHIRGLIAALQRLETEIQYGYTPLPEALRRIGMQSKEPLRAFFLTAAEEMSPPHNCSAEEAVQRSMEIHWSSASLKGTEKEIFRQLSCTLGTSDRSNQSTHIALALQQLKQEETAAREDQGKYEKVSKSLGLLLGALIVILIF
ncbi:MULTISPECIES: stage III sporulation protein SpoIIIAB [Paenibacillus]|jgi:stage III sporulation protein AB|uniref:Stage III sporulation protein AB n=1 Tax=Paenibacillus phytohabitans TaxID=2654978 RepID=A0ABX1YGC2_9BACL|nr:MULTISPECIES: stage III sporulation protein SpoIIIAB [Paenibacillus]AIQ31001.1 stage III sporulation protein AB [Paenibacillus sp. FSL P4-0081]KHL96437.1 stage III sporulation protein AB [Paenibacillus sp. IHB B 3415]NOU78814.1 stage III sporulation protein AB [Paenibacillus phytohabitans]OMF25446.1 stage III sporulation protein AB [Paenibacillus sp. FSL H8-0259]